MKEQKYVDFGNRLIELRKSKGLKQKNCLRPLGNITTSMLSSWENGYCFPQLKYLIKLAKFYEVSLDYLILGKKDDGTKYNSDNYKDVILCLNTLKESGVFEINLDDPLGSNNLHLYLSTFNSNITDYYSKYQKLENAYEQLGEDTFKEKIKELISKYDYKIEEKDD